MPANTAPIFPLVPKVEWGTITTANTAKDGTGTVVPIFTAGTNGSRVDTIRIRSTGTAVATVVRIFVNNGSTNTVATNNSLVLEATIASTTGSEVAALADNTLSLGMTLPAGYVLNATIGTTVASALAITAFGGDY